MPDDFNQPLPPPRPHSSAPTGPPPGGVYTPPQTSQPGPPPYGQPTYAQAPYGQPRYAAAAGPFAGNANPYAAMYAPPRPRSPWFWPAILLSGVIILGLLCWAMVWSVMRGGDDTTTSSGSAFASDRIAVIDLTGVILDADKTDTQLRKFGQDSSVKAIILHINSPGGGAAASQEIFHEVLRVRHENHKKVIASVESVGASGAYYIASACDKIYANDASVVGSIGVIMEWTNYGDLYRWARLKSVVIHAGELKDAGDPTHDMTPKEAAYFQSLVDNMYAQFIHDVADGRHTSFDKIAPLATGQVWTGQQSLPLGLIDKVGGFRTALVDTARDAGMKGEPAIVRPAAAHKGLAALLNGDADEIFPTAGKLLDRSPGFYFMWK